MDNDFGVGNKIYRVKISNIDWEITDEKFVQLFKIS